MGMMIAPSRFSTGLIVVTGAPQFVTSATNSSTGGLPASVSVTYPAGLQADDVALLYATAENELGALTLTGPAGWTEEANLQFGNATGLRHGVWSKRLVGSESGSLTMSTNGSGGSGKYRLDLIIYRGVLASGTFTEQVTTDGIGSTGADGAVGVRIQSIASRDRTRVHFHSIYKTAGGPAIGSIGSGFTSRAAGVTGSIRHQVSDTSIAAPAYCGEYMTLAAAGQSYWGSIAVGLIPQTGVSSTTPVTTDANIGSVVFLSSADGVDASLRLLNEIKPSTLSSRVVGTTIETDTAQSKFGGASIRANAGSFTFPDNADWELGSGNFTVEAWVRFNAVAAGTFRPFFGHYDTNAQRSWELGIGTTNNLEMNLSADGSAISSKGSGAWTPSTGVWYHVAGDFDGTNYRTYVDGVMKGKTGTPVTLFNSTAPLSIGAALATGAINGAFDGWLDEIRITKGVARYASDGGFTPPTAAFPRQ